MKTSAKKHQKPAKSRVLGTLPRAKVVILGGCGRSAQKWTVHNHTLQEKKPDQKILFFHGEN
mgnify:CR=1 FL=1